MTPDYAACMDIHDAQLTSAHGLHQEQLCLMRRTETSVDWFRDLIWAHTCAHAGAHAGAHGHSGTDGVVRIR